MYQLCHTNLTAKYGGFERNMLSSTNNDTSVFYKGNWRRNHNAPIRKSKWLCGAEFTSKLFCAFLRRYAWTKAMAIMHRCFKRHELLLQHAVFWIRASLNLLDNDPVIINTSGTSDNNSGISSFLNTRRTFRFLIGNQRRQFYYFCTDSSAVMSSIPDTNFGIIASTFLCWSDYKHARPPLPLEVTTHPRGCLVNDHIFVDFFLYTAIQTVSFTSHFWVSQITSEDT